MCRVLGVARPLAASFNFGVWRHLFTTTECISDIHRPSVCGPEGGRTPYLTNANRALYQLSYRPRIAMISGELYKEHLLYEFSIENEDHLNLIVIGVIPFDRFRLNPVAPKTHFLVKFLSWLIFCCACQIQTFYTSIFR
jgi:hypothetical protein